MGLALVAEQPETFGTWLKRTRTEKGVTQRQLANAAGCTEQYIGRIERNADVGKDGLPSKPSIAFVDAWAKVLEMPPNELRRIAGHPQIITSKEQSERVILDYYEGASEESREIMRAVLKTIYEVDIKRAASGAEAPQQIAEDSQEEAAGEWPGAETTSKKSSKNSKRR